VCGRKYGVRVLRSDGCSSNFGQDDDIDGMYVLTVIYLKMMDGTSKCRHTRSGGYASSACTWDKRIKKTDTLPSRPTHMPLPPPPPHTHAHKTPM
jgi:hypothetical protein